MSVKKIVMFSIICTSILNAFEQIKTLQQLTSKIHQNTAVIIKVYREDCPPCRQLSPILHRFAQKYNNYSYFEVNSSKSLDIVSAYKINKVPTLLYFYNGQLKGKDTGFQSYTALEKRIQELFN